MNTEVQRLAITGSLLYSAYLAYTCPCATICACKLDAFLISVAIPVGIVLYYNVVMPK